MGEPRLINVEEIFKNLDCDLCRSPATHMLVLDRPAQVVQMVAIFCLGHAETEKGRCLTPEAAAVR